MKTKLLIFLTFAFLCNFADLFANNPSLTGTVVSVTGEVRDQITMKPTSITIEVFESNGDKYVKTKSNSKDGYYFVTGLKPGEKYTFKISDLKYFSQSFEISIPNTDKYLEYSKDIVVIPAHKNLELPLKVNPFEISNSNLRPGADFFLKDILQFLKENPNVKISIVSFPDNNKDEKKNQVLTTGRALAIKDYLITNGITPDRLETKGNAKTDPTNPPPTKKTAKGKKYVGTVLMQLTSF